MAWTTHRKRAVASYAICALGAIGFCAPTFVHPDWMGGWDQNYFHAWDEAARRSILEFGQLPLWNPHHCGGRTSIGHVASTAQHPLFFVLTLPLGSAIAHKLYVLLHVFAAMTGMVAWLKRRPTTLAGQLLGGLVWGGCGYFGWHYAGGHISYLGLSLTPWMLVALEKARTDVRHGVSVGAILAWTFLMAGAYSYPLMVVLVAVHSISSCVSLRSLKPLVGAAIAAAVSIGLAAYKFLPVADFSSANARPSAMLQATMPWDLVRMLLDRESRYGVLGDHAFTWPEYGSYIGYIMFAFVIVGVASGWARRHKHETFMLVVVTAIACGNVDWYWPYPLLRKLPLYSQLRVPTRYFVFSALYLSMFGALGLSRWQRRLALHEGDRARFANVAAMVIVFAAGAEVISFSAIEMARAYNVEPVEQSREPFHARIVHNPQTEAYAGPTQNFTILNCYEEGANPQSPNLWAGRVEQVRTEPGSGSARLAWWSTNVLIVEASLSRTAVVRINQNHDAHWRADGHEVIDTGGLLSVRLPEGEHRVVLRYEPRPFWIGLALTILTVLVLVGWAIGARLRRARRR